MRHFGGSSPDVIGLVALFICEDQGQHRTASHSKHSYGGDDRNAHADDRGRKVSLHHHDPL
eukprot:5713299-Amphidinium_carterae.1